MVLKLAFLATHAPPEFESDVISDGTQTLDSQYSVESAFESDVISDGTQTIYFSHRPKFAFESDVISDGIFEGGVICDS